MARPRKKATTAKPKATKKVEEVLEVVKPKEEEAKVEEAPKAAEGLTPRPVRDRQVTKYNGKMKVVAIKNFRTRYGAVVVQMTEGEMTTVEPEIGKRLQQMGFVK